MMFRLMWCLTEALFTMQLQLIQICHSWHPISICLRLACCDGFISVLVLCCVVYTNSTKRKV